MIGSTTQSDGTEIVSTCAKTHPDFQLCEGNDIAVLKLATNVTDIQPVALNTNTDLPAGGSDVTVIGFGQTTAGCYTTKVSETLQKLTYKAVSPDDCKAQLPDDNMTTIVCARNTEETGVSALLFY